MESLPPPDPHLVVKKRGEQTLLYLCPGVNTQQLFLFTQVEVY